MAKKSYDWVAIKIQFVNSSLSIPDFAESFGIPKSTLSKQVAQGNWLEERARIGMDTESKSIEYSINNRAAKLAQIDDDCVKTAEEINRKLRELLPSIDSPMALKALAGTLKDTQAVTRLALGASTDNQSVGSQADYAKWLEEIDSGTFERG